MRVKDYDARSMSRVEERRWLGMQGADPQDDPRENWRDDPPQCVDCRGEADMFCDSHWICDRCDDAREGLAA
jgi:hypothetical protein